MILFFELFFTLTGILLAASIFVNAVEALGEVFELSDNVVGSLFAAVGTALPETLIPILAFIDITQNTSVHEYTQDQALGLGAIVGAPLMLSTLTIGLIAYAAYLKKGKSGLILVEPNGFSRDINFFLSALFIMIVAFYIPLDKFYLKYLLSGMLIIGYGCYVWLTLKSSNEAMQSHEATLPSTLFYGEYCRLPKNKFTIILQLI